MKIDPKAAVLASAVAVWSFSWTCIVGHFGIFAFDQSIVFDGGWRILAGQIPYKDFVMAFTPLTFVIQAAFFKAFGVSWTSMVVAAAVVGVIAALSVMRTMALLFGRQHTWLVGGAGFLVGTSFQAIFGTLWMEQVAFAFWLLAVQAICESVRLGPWPRVTCVGLAGVLSALAFLSKQNAGGPTLAVVVALAVAASLPDWRGVVTSLAATLAGVVVTACLFLLWLFHYSDPASFVRHALEVPAQMGGERVAVKFLFPPYLLTRIQGSTQWCYAVAFGAVLYAFFVRLGDRGFPRTPMESRWWRMIVLLTAAVPFMQSLLQMTISNDSQNLLALSGMSLSLGIGLFGFCLGGAANSRERRWVTAVACGVSFFLVFEMVWAGWTRRVHDVFPRGAALSRTLRVPRLSHVRWIRPTYTSFVFSAVENRVAVEPEDVEAICAYLAASRRDFFVLGDSTYLYGVSGVVPPQPLLYLQAGHIYRERDAARIDDWVLSSLKRRGIRLIVREKTNVSGYFPLVGSLRWIADNFQPGPVFGNFEVLLRSGTSD